MSEKQEAIADIIEKMRRDANVHCSIPTKYLNAYADRLEAALKCELESMSGNAAKLREAIEAVLLAFNYGESTIVNQLPFIKLLPMLRKCVEALAEPSRNCDKFDTKDTAREAFQKLRGHRVLADVSLWDDRDEIEAFLDWLFATKKGGVNAGK